MLSVTLLILQIVGLLTYPPVLGSIFTGQNIVKYIADMNCTTTTGDTSSNASCEQMKMYKWEILFVMIFFLTSVTCYILSIFFRNSHTVCGILILVGSILSLVGSILIIYILLSMTKDLKNQGVDSSSTKYLWYLCSLSLGTSFISGIVGLIGSYKMLKK